MKIFKEFKEFAVKGNMIDIAIGVIIGSAFNKVIDAIVEEVFLPPLSLLTNGVNWQNKKIILRKASEGVTKVEEVAIGYGKLVETFTDFLIISLTVFVIVKFMNSLKNRAQDINDDTVKTPKDIELLNKTVELLQKQNEMLEQKMKS